MLKHLGILCLSMAILVGCSKKDEGEDNPTPTPPEPTPKEEVVKKQSITVELPKEVDKKILDELVVSNAYGNFKLTEKPEESKPNPTGRGAINGNVFYGGTFQYTSPGLIINNVLNQQGDLMMCCVTDPTARTGSLIIDAEQTAIALLMLRPELITSNKAEFQQAVKIIRSLPEFGDYRAQVAAEMLVSMNARKCPNYSGLNGYNRVLVALLKKVRANISNSNESQVEFTKGSMKKKDGAFNFTVTNHLKRVIHIYPKKMKLQNNGLIASEEYIDEGGLSKVEVLKPQGTNYWKVVYGSLQGETGSIFKATTDPISVDIGDADKLKLEIYGVGQLEKPFDEYSEDEKKRILIAFLHGGYSDFIKPIIDLALGLEDLGNASGVDNFKYDFRYGSRNHPLRQLLTTLAEDFMKDPEELKKFLKSIHDREFLIASGQLSYFMVQQLLNNPDAKKQNQYMSNIYELTKMYAGVTRTKDIYRSTLKSYYNQSSHILKANFVTKVIKISELSVDIAGAIYAYFNTNAVSQLIEDRADAPYFTLISPKEGEAFNDTKTITFRWDFFRGNFNAFGDRMKIDLVIECLQRDGSYIIETIPDLPYDAREKTVDLNTIASFKGLYIFRWKVIARHRLNSNMKVESAYGNFRTKELAPLTLSTDAVTLKKGENVQVNITSGTGSYTLATSNAYIATASLVKMNTITVFGKGKGTAVIVVTDNESGEKKSITVNVQASASDIPDGVIIENGVLKKWPCDKIPDDGKVVIPNTVTEIGRRAFFDCSELIAVEIPNSVTIINEQAFSSCKGLTAINIPSTVENIGYEAFSNCNGLTSVIIADGVKKIDDYAFSGCSNISKVVIPNSVKYMGTRVFLDCASLVTVKLSENILSIPHSTFNRCYSLKNVDFSSRLTRVEDYAFSECTSLVSMTLPNTITYIGNNAFLKSKKFNSITIKATKPPLVAPNSFNYTNLSSVFVPEVSIDAYKTFWSSIFDISKLKPITN
jgi:surface antigen bspA-like